MFSATIEPKRRKLVQLIMQEREKMSIAGENVPSARETYDSISEAPEHVLDFWISQHESDKPLPTYVW
jgi:hypothetical protein